MSKQRLISPPDIDLWESSHHNPVLMLAQLVKRGSLKLWRRSVLAQMDRAARQLEDYSKNAHGIARIGDQDQIRDHVEGSNSSPYYPPRIRGRGSLAFCWMLCLFFCWIWLSRLSLPVYSGGLGVLADLKSASDLVYRFVWSRAYQQGYFAQYLNADGWQQERYPTNDFYNMLPALGT